MHLLSVFFFFNDTATTEIYTLSLHDALPIYEYADDGQQGGLARAVAARRGDQGEADDRGVEQAADDARSEEHTSELQSRQYLVCRLLLEKKKTMKIKKDCCNTIRNRCIY